MSKDHQSHDPGWHLIAAHQYEEAVAAYDAKLAAGKEKWPVIVANRAIALLCLGRLSEALEDVSTANDDARQSNSARLEHMGTVLWLMGHRSVAKELYRSAVDGIRYGTIGYADIAGGVGQGLLLWYAGITTKDRSATEHAIDYLTRLAKKSHRREDDARRGRVGTRDTTRDQARYEEADRLRCRAIERAQIEADLAQRRYMLVDPSSSPIFRSFVARCLSILAASRWRSSM
jgi:tetratricopeptide (TPR) repeat protein